MKQLFFGQRDKRQDCLKDTIWVLGIRNFDRLNSVN
jgi:hypothetical protein